MTEQIDTEAESVERNRIGAFEGFLLGAVAVVVVGLAVFGAATLVGRSTGSTHAQNAPGMERMMQSTSGSASEGDMPSMMAGASAAGAGAMNEMVKACTQHMNEMSAMMQMMQGTSVPSP